MSHTHTQQSSCPPHQLPMVTMLSKYSAEHARNKQFPSLKLCVLLTSRIKPTPFHSACPGHDGPAHVSCICCSPINHAIAISVITLSVTV